MNTILGLDGGASGVRLHRIERSSGGFLRCIGGPLVHGWRDTGDFGQVSLERQLAEGDEPRLSAGEIEEGEERIRVIAGLIARCTADSGGGPIRLGLCMPGPKTADGKGIAVLRRGPRMPDFVRMLEGGLAARGVCLDAPIQRLSDDGDAAIQGEVWATDGHLHGVASAYLVSPGTGLAEGLLINGRFLQMSAMRDVLVAPWLTGHEDRLGMHGLHERLGGSDTIGGMALAGHSNARELLTKWAEDLAAFLAARLECLDAHGRAVDRVVVGARGGELLANPSLAEFTRRPLESAFTHHHKRRVPEGFLVPSTLCAAPAIGAAADALGLVEHA